MDGADGRDGTGGTIGTDGTEGTDGTNGTDGRDGERTNGRYGRNRRHSVNKREEAKGVTEAGSRVQENSIKQQFKQLKQHYSSEKANPESISTSK